MRSAMESVKPNVPVPALRYQRRERERDHKFGENHSWTVMLPPVGTSAIDNLETIAAVPRSIYAGGSPGTA